MDNLLTKVTQTALMSNMVSYMDLFGVRPILYFRGNFKASTVYGKFFSLTIYAFAVWSIIFLSDDFLGRRNPSVATSSIQADSSSPYVLNFSSFQYMFGIMSPESDRFIQNDSIFTLTAQITYTNGSKYPLIMSSCLPSSTDYEDNIPGHLYCFNQNQTVDMQGSKTHIEVSLSKCTNTTKKELDCLDEPLIDEFLLNSRVLFFYQRSALNTNNYTVPIQKNWSFQDFAFLPNWSKKIQAIIKTISMDTNDGWLLNNHNYVIDMVHSDLYYDIQPLQTPTYMSFEIYSLGDIDIVSRIYPKFQSLVAEIFGLLQLACLIFYILVVPYARFKMYERIGNEAFSLRIDHKPLKTDEEIKKRRRLRNLDYIKHPRKNGGEPMTPSIFQDRGANSQRDFMTAALESEHQMVLETEQDNTIREHKSSKDSKEESEENEIVIMKEKEPEIKPSILENGQKSPILRFDSIFSRGKTIDGNNGGPGDHESKNKSENIENGQKSPILRLDSIFSRNKNLSATKSNRSSRNTSIIQPKEFRDEAKVDIEMIEELSSGTQFSSAQKGNLEPAGMNRRERRSALFYTSERKEVDFSLSYFEWIASWFVKSPKIILLKKLTNEIMHRLDIMTISKKLVELDLLKNFLLTDYQRVLFDNLKKPKLKLTISNDPKYRNSSKMPPYHFKTDSFLDSFTGNRELIREAYDALYKNPTQAPIDRKIISRYKEFSPKTHMLQFSIQTRDYLEN